MMASIEHVMPSEMIIEDGTGFSKYRPGNIVTRQDTGNYRSHSLFGYNLQEYRLNFTPNDYSDDVLAQIALLFRHTAMNARPFWIKEPIIRDHRYVLGEITSEGKTTYLLPLDPTESTTPIVFLDGVPQDASAYTVHDNVNLVATDNYASVEVAGALSVSNGSAALAARMARHGLASYKVTSDGLANTAVWAGPWVEGLSVGDYYTSVVAMFATASAAENYKWQIIWGTDVPGYFTVTRGSDVSVSAGSWVVNSFTDAVPSGAASALPSLMRNVIVGLSPFYVDCFALCPGDCSRWFLPSVGMRCVEFATAPAAGQRLAFSEEACYRFTRVVMDRPAHVIALESLGTATQAVMTVREVPFRRGE